VTRTNQHGHPALIRRSSNWALETSRKRGCKISVKTACLRREQKNDPRRYCTHDQRGAALRQGGHQGSRLRSRRRSAFLSTSSGWHRQRKRGYLHSRDASCGCACSARNISVVGVDYVQVVNQTLGQKATLLRLAADGFFSSAVPVTEGKNQIDVLARASDGSNARQSITVYYQPGIQKSLDLEIFLEKEKNLQLEVNRLGKSPAEIQREVERNRQDSLSKPNQLPPPTDGPAR
jgi:glucodextranase-like protein